MLSKNRKMYLAIYLLGTTLLVLSMMLSAYMVKTLAMG